MKEEHYPFFWQGKPEQETREYGIGFAVRNHLLQMITPPTEGTKGCSHSTYHQSKAPQTSCASTTPQCQPLQKQRTNFMMTLIQQSRIYHQMSFFFYSETSMQEWGVTETYGQPAWVIMDWKDEWKWTMATGILLHTQLLCDQQLLPDKAPSENIMEAPKIWSLAPTGSYNCQMSVSQQCPLHP